MKKITFIIYIYFFAIITGKAQDFHFSQFDANPLYLNPALSGERINENKGILFHLNYREQIGNYNHGAGSNASIAAGFDVPVNSKFSVGEYIINNKSVDGAFNTLNVMLAGAYRIINKDVDDNNRHNLSIGLQLGFMQKSFHPQKFVFDSQYSSSSANGFDSNLPSGESFNTQSFFNFDANVGIYYRSTSKNKKTSPFFGFSIYHLTQPNESFYGINSPTPMRFNIHAGVLLKTNEVLSILPQMLYMNQANANEVNAGMLLFYKIKESFNEPMIGASWRNKNAVIAHVGLKTKSFIFRVSYDLNTYYLKEYNNRGLEFSVIYTANRKKKVESEKTEPNEKDQNDKKENRKIVF